MNVHETQFYPLGSGAEALVVDGEVVTAAALPDRATHALVQAKTKAAMVGFGENPASGGAGLLLAVNEVHVFTKAALAQARFIEAVGGENGTVYIVPGTF